MQRHPLDQPLVSAPLLAVPELARLPGADPANAPLRVVVVAADPVVAGAFEQRLGRHVVGHAEPAGVAEAVARHRSNVVLWDLGPGEPTITDLATLAVPVVILAASTAAAARLLSAGAKGVLRRDASDRAIASALDTVRHDLQVVDATLAGPAGAFGEARGRANGPVESLTPREVQVLEQVATGRSNKQIAAELGISAHTVKFHVNAILTKLDVHTRTQAVVRGVQYGMIVV